MTTPQEHNAQAEAAAAYLREEIALLKEELTRWERRIAQGHVPIGNAPTPDLIVAGEAQRSKRASVRRRPRKVNRALGPSQQVVATLLQEAGQRLTVAELTETAFSRQLITSKNGREGVRSALASAISRMTKNGSVFLDRDTHRYGLPSWSQNGIAQPLSLVVPS